MNKRGDELWTNGKSDYQVFFQTRKVDPFKIAAHGQNKCKQMVVGRRAGAMAAPISLPNMTRYIGCVG